MTQREPTIEEVQGWKPCAACGDPTSGRCPICGIPLHAICALLDGCPRPHAGPAAQLQDDILRDESRNPDLIGRRPGMAWRVEAA